MQLNARQTPDLAKKMDALPRLHNTTPHPCLSVFYRDKGLHAQSDCGAPVFSPSFWFDAGPLLYYGGMYIARCVGDKINQSTYVYRILIQNYLLKSLLAKIGYRFIVYLLKVNRRSLLPGSNNDLPYFQNKQLFSP